MIGNARLAPSRLQECCEYFDGSRLPGTVGADEAEAVPLVNLKIEIAQRDQIAVAFCEIDSFDHDGHMILNSCVKR